MSISFFGTASGGATCRRTARSECIATKVVWSILPDLVFILFKINTGRVLLASSPFGVCVLFFMLWIRFYFGFTASGGATCKRMARSE